MLHDLRLLAVGLVVAAIVALAPGDGRAQGLTGAAVSGTIVLEGDGGFIPGATIQLRNTSTGDSFNTISGIEGEYVFDNVPPGGPYMLAVQAEGYLPLIRNNLNLRLGQRLNVAVELKLLVKTKGEEIVIVERLDDLFDRGRTGPSTTVKETALGKLPLQGRNFTDLVATSPMVVGNSVAGQNSRFNNIQIDGGANNDLFGLATSTGTPGGQANAKPISLEAIKEFVVQVAPFDVRQGSFAGGLVNAITKSGTNTFHGSLFGYFQNKALVGLKDDPQRGVNDFNVMQLGGTLSGPIIKDKLHFFVSADIQQRETTPSSTIAGITSDDDLARAGLDSATVQRFRDILSNQYGIENVGDATVPTLKNPDRNIFGKLTTSLIPNSHLEVSYNLVDAGDDNIIRSPTAPTVPGRLRDGFQLSNSGYEQANTTHTLRTKLTTTYCNLSNEFLAGFSIIRDERALPQRLPLILVKVGQIGASDSWLAAGAERFSHQNFLDQNIFQLQDNATLKLGRHRLTVGTSNELLSLRNVFLQAADGVWAFDSLDALEAGTATAFQRRFGVAGSGQAPGTAEFDVFQLGLYAQDEWSILDNLTVSLGFRVDVPFLSDAVTNPTLLASPVDGGIDTGEVPSGNLLLSPRLGFNWDVLSDASTIVRGGVGIFTGRPPYVWVSNAYSTNGLSFVDLSCTGATGVPGFVPDPNNQPSDCMGGTSVPGAPANAGEIDYFDPGTRYPQNLKAALGVDRRLPWDVIASADLLYTRDVNGWYTADENLMEQGTSGEGRQLYGTFAAMGFRATPSRIDTMNLNQAVKVFNKNGGRVWNASLQLQKNFINKKDLSFDASVAYTYSNSRDRMSFTSSQALSNFQFAPLDGSIEDRNVRPSAFDRPHKITLAGTASFPLGFGAGVTYILQSGTPYTWTVNGDVNADGISGNDLVYVPASASDISLADDPANPNDGYDALSSFIESQECLQGARGRFVKRGECRNPMSHLVNLRLAWSSPPLYKDGHRLEVQLDFFNFLNLLNSEWGLFSQSAQFENHASAFLRATGYDAALNRPIYTFVAPSAVTQDVYSATLSRWRIQLGARYSF